MTHQYKKTVELGDLVVTVFDEAAQSSADPREVSRLAVEVIGRMLGRTQRASPAWSSKIEKRAVA